MSKSADITCTGASPTLDERREAADKNGETIVLDADVIDLTHSDSESETETEDAPVAKETEPTTPVVLPPPQPVAKGSARKRRPIIDSDSEDEQPVAKDPVGERRLIDSESEDEDAPVATKLSAEEFEKAEADALFFQRMHCNPFTADPNDPANVVASLPLLDLYEKAGIPLGSDLSKAQAAAKRKRINSDDEDSDDEAIDLSPLKKRVKGKKRAKGKKQKTPPKMDDSSTGSETEDDGSDRRAGSARKADTKVRFGDFYCRWIPTNFLGRDSVEPFEAWEPLKWGHKGLIPARTSIKGPRPGFGIPSSPQWNVKWHLINYDNEEVPKPTLTLARQNHIKKHYNDTFARLLK